MNIGRIHVSAGMPIVMRSSSESNVSVIAKSVQQVQRCRTLVSDYHIDAGAVVLNLHPDQICQALSILRCPFWPRRSYVAQLYDSHMILSKENLDEMWSIFLQCAHHFAPYFAETHPMWCRWLNSSFHSKGQKSGDMHQSVDCVVQSLTRLLNNATSVVDITISMLGKQGYSTLTFDHILQYSKNCVNSGVDRLPTLLIIAAIEMKLGCHNEFSIATKGEMIKGKTKPSDTLTIHYPSSHTSGVLDTNNIHRNVEAFGAWGYSDSQFIIKIIDDGSKCITMTGNRYEISGKSITNVIPFLEQETGVKVIHDKVVLPSASKNVTVLPSAIDSNDLQKIVNLMTEPVNTNRLSTDDLVRARHGTGHSQEDMYIIRSGELQNFRLPDAVFFPICEIEVEKIVSLAVQEDWCLIPFGGGTNVSHATWCPVKEVEPRLVLSVDMSFMNRIILLDKENLFAHVEAGITGNDLIRDLEVRGFTMGHEPDSFEFSTLGGWIATKASGMKRSKYGNIEDIVREVRVVGSGGLMWQNGGGNSSMFGRVSTGMDLCSLMLGSEGSLGIVTSAIIKICPLPEVKDFESVIFPTFEDGLQFVHDISKLGAMKPASVRLLDNKQFRLGQSMKSSKSSLDVIKAQSIKLAGILLGKGEFSSNVVCVTITFEGTSLETNMQKSSIRKLSLQHGGLRTGSKIGKSGYHLTFAIAYLRDFAMTYGFLAESFETFCNWSKVRDLIDGTKECIKREHMTRKLPGTPFISCRVTQLYSEGVCVYFYFCMNFKHVPEPSKVFAEIECVTRQTILDFGGSLSHHHGVGKLRSRFMKNVNSSKLENVLLEMKSAVDPHNTFGCKNGVYYPPVEA